jgi:uncharacterized membrane protein
MYVLFVDKSYFVSHESNKLIKYSLESGMWYIYPVFAISFYFTMIIISKKYPVITIRALFLNLAILQIGTPLVWLYPPTIFLAFFFIVIVVIYYPLYKFKSYKNKKGSTIKRARYSYSY